MSDTDRVYAADPLIPGPGIIVARGLLYTVLALLVVAFAWTAMTQVNVVVHTRGKLVVRGEPIQITAAESALVMEVPVRVGQHVAEGDVLVRLDAFQHEAAARGVSADCEVLRAEASRHLQAVDGLAKLRTLIETEYETARAVRDLVSRQLARMEELRNRSTPAATTVEVENARKALLEAKERVTRLGAELVRNRNQTAERRQLAVETQERIRAKSIKLAELREYEARSVLVSPAAGTVTHLAVLHPGTMIGTTEPAVTIVPDGQPLMARIEIPNAHMRRLRKGMAVRVELDAFPYQDYGHIEGELTDIEPDADELGNYRAWASLKRGDLGARTNLEQLKPGLMMHAKLVVERRSVLDLLMKPMKRLGNPISVAD